MSSPIVARLRRALQDARDKYAVGMSVGMPQVTVDASDLERAINERDALQDYNDQLTERVHDLERERDDARAALRESCNEARALCNAEGLLCCPLTERVRELEEALRGLVSKDRDIRDFPDNYERARAALEGEGE